jgi:hypothetical protein
MPLQATSGAASYDAFGGGAAVVPAYIEEVFATWLYTGNGSTQTITNGIDLSGKGGLVWIKGRSGATDHALYDTARGATFDLVSNSAAAQTTQATGLTAFGSTGFSIGALAKLNTNTATYVSWTFREQPKFFDVVTYTGTGANRTIAHNLGSVPGCIIVKSSSAGDDWNVYHRSLANTQYLNLGSTAQATTGATKWNSTTPTSTVFSLGTDGGVNRNGTTYVAYLFAHDAGGFGLTGTDNVVSCGSYTGNGSATGPVISLGYEPQWLMVKNSTGTGDWQIIDNMRGMPVAIADSTLQANSSSAETSVEYVSPTSTGFQITSTSTQVNTNASIYIYIAIRRGPMKVPTTGTSVFGLNARTGTDANATVTGGQTDDAVLIKNRGSTDASLFSARLIGTEYNATSSTAASASAGVTILQANPWDVMDGVKVGTTSTITNASANTYINYLFKRAPSFMDVVCYSGNGTTLAVNHNLTVAPELIIVRSRNRVQEWRVLSTALSQTSRFNGSLVFSSTSLAVFFGDGTNYIAPTSSVFTLGGSGDVNAGTGTYIAYLFATCPGVSKVGTYTGNGTTQTINCAITAGARFVLIKRADAAGDWYVYDTARGMTAMTDPYWLTNSTAAEVATLGSVTTVATGFALNSTILAAINVSAATYVFLAIA